MIVSSLQKSNAKQALGDSNCATEHPEAWRTEGIKGPKECSEGTVLVKVP